MLLWILIGLGAGWTIGALMLGKDSRRSRQLSAGLIGAFVGPFILQLADPRGEGRRVDCFNRGTRGRTLARVDSLRRYIGRRRDHFT
jgi:uncharacterized membrane protein YeaQ/YmgE (transglycosylase-associated protein family)